MDQLQELRFEIARLRQERDALRAALTRLYRGAKGYRDAQQAAREALWLTQLGDAQDKEVALGKVREVVGAQAALFAALDATPNAATPLDTTLDSVPEPPKPQ